jgi:hypothetical protein
MGGCARAAGAPPLLHLKNDNCTSAGRFLGLSNGHISPQPRLYTVRKSGVFGAKIGSSQWCNPFNPNQKINTPLHPIKNQMVIFPPYNHNVKSYARQLSTGDEGEALGRSA